MRRGSQNSNPMLNSSANKPIAAPDATTANDRLRRFIVALRPGVAIQQVVRHQVRSAEFSGFDEARQPLGYRRDKRCKAIESPDFTHNPSAGAQRAPQAATR